MPHLYYTYLNIVKELGPLILYIHEYSAETCPFISVIWLIHVIHVCDETHPYVRHDSSICTTWLIHICDMTHSHVQHDSFISATWLIHMCNMTHSYLRHDSFTCATWLTHMCDMTNPYVRHDSFTCATWLTHICSQEISSGCTNLIQGGEDP